MLLRQWKEVQTVLRPAQLTPNPWLQATATIVVLTAQFKC